MFKVVVEMSIACICVLCDTVKHNDRNIVDGGKISKCSYMFKRPTGVLDMPWSQQG